MEIGLKATVLQPPPSACPPVLDLTPQDVAVLHDALVAYHQEFAPLFARREQRHWALKYLEGQLLPIARKSIEPMAHALDGGNVQAMQQFISDGAWDDAAILAQHQRLVAQSLGDGETGVVILDGTDFPKQGTESVGVARQWCGALGKVANCQASVVACYASRHGYTLVDRRLYLPEEWFTAAYAPRRKDCAIPPDQTFETRPALAWDMLAHLRAQGVLPFAWVTGDEHFGQNPVLLDQIAAAGLSYLMEVPHSTRVWLTRPPTAVPPTTSTRGHPFTRLRLTPDAPPPVEVAVLAAQVPAEDWVPALIKEGSKGPLVAEVAFLRVVAVRDGLPGPDVWLVLRRTLSATPELKTYLCNAPADSAKETLVWLLGMRWPIEQAIKEGKDELGMDHYEVRTWRGWHHHLTMTLLAHHFLVQLRGQLGKKSTGADRAPGAPAPQRDAPPPPTRLWHGARARPRDPGAQLCGLLRAPRSHTGLAGSLAS
jgi:SRSO17 transposase